MSEEVLPLRVLSSEEAEKILKISVPKAKKVSELVSASQAPLDVYLTTPVDNEGTESIFQEGLAKAVTTPHLRASILLTFGAEGTCMFLYEASEQKLSAQEIRGALISSYESLKDNDNRKFVIPCRELNQTHMIHGSSFSQYLITKREDIKDCEIVIINIHHDYIRGYASLGDEELLLHAFYELHQFLLKGTDEVIVLEEK
jgi:hypothetical protein